MIRVNFGTWQKAITSEAELALQLATKYTVPLASYSGRTRSASNEVTPMFTNYIDTIFEMTCTETQKAF